MAAIFGESQWRKWTVVTLILFIVLVNGSKQGKRIPNYAGPYRALVTRVLNVSEDYASIGKVYFRLRTTQVRGKQPQYVWGHSYTEISVTDEMRVEVRMATRSNNEWKKNAFVFNFDKACSSCLMHAESIALILFGHKVTCPFPAVGYREIKNHTFEFVFPKFPVMPYGRYLFTLAIIRPDNTVIGVGAADIDIVPKL